MQAQNNSMLSKAAKQNIGGSPQLPKQLSKFDENRFDIFYDADRSYLGGPEKSRKNGLKLNAVNIVKPRGYFNADLISPRQVLASLPQTDI